MSNYVAHEESKFTCFSTQKFPFQPASHVKFARQALFLQIIFKTLLIFTGLWEEPGKVLCAKLIQSVLMGADFFVQSQRCGGARKKAFGRIS